MNKTRLLRFVQKYHLGGLVESVKWTVDGNVLSTKFISEDKSVLGEVLLNDFEFDDCEIGLYNTTKLIKMVSVIENEIDMSLGITNNKNVSLKLDDGNTLINYMLANLAVIPKVPEVKTMPKWDVVITFDQEFINKFSKAAGALMDSSTFTLLTDVDGSAKIIVGYSTINSDRVSINVDAKFDSPIDPIAFRTDYLKEILNNNKESDAGIINVSSEGLSYIEFEVDNYLSKYYMIQISSDV